MEFETMDAKWKSYDTEIPPLSFYTGSSTEAAGPKLRCNNPGISLRWRGNPEIGELDEASDSSRESNFVLRDAAASEAHRHPSGERRAINGKRSRGEMRKGVKTRAPLCLSICRLSFRLSGKERGHGGRERERVSCLSLVRLRRSLIPRILPAFDITRGRHRLR